LGRGTACIGWAAHHSPDEGLDGGEELLDAALPHHLRDDPAETNATESGQPEGFQARGVLAEGEGGGRDEESYSRRAGTRCRLGSPGRRGAEELPPGSAVPHPPHRGRSPSSGCRFCDISGELAPMPDRRRPAGRNLTRAPRRTDGQATTNRK
jgi:hypothetical protein